MISTLYKQYKGENMILLIGGEKGGTGKTTIATNLAVMRASEGHEVLLVDTDPQKTASYWSLTRDERGITPKITCVQKTDNVKAEINALKGKFDDIIIDAGGRDSIELRTSMLVADLAVFPFRPSQFDLWTLAKMDKHLKEVILINETIKAFLVINQASSNPSVKEKDNAKSHLEEFPDIHLLKSVIAERIAFRKAAIQGMSVMELTNNDDQKAKDEIESLYKEIFNV
jgi:chromosome partitioning protein